MKQEIIKQLKKIRACEEAVEWAKGKRTVQSAWKNCERGDWLLWIIGKTAAGKPWSDERKPLVLAACECARLALKDVPKGEERPRIAIEKAEAWAREEATKEDVKKAAAAAYADADAAASAAVVASVGAVAASASAAVAAAAASAAASTYAAASTSASAYASASAASASAYASASASAAVVAAKEKVFKKCATIVRKYYPNPPELMKEDKG